MEFPLLSTILLAPIVAAFALCFVSKDDRETIRKVAAGATIFTLCLTVYAFFSFDTTTSRWISPIPAIVICFVSALFS